MEAILVLRRAMELNPKDANAPYYLGNLLYDWQPEEATKLWEQSAAINPTNPLVHRNLAVAYSHRGTNSDLAKAITELEQAVASNRKYAMHFAELDELYADTGKSPEQRLALLEQNHSVMLKRDDALSREIGLKVFAGKYDEAIQLMTGRKFSVWKAAPSTWPSIGSTLTCCEDGLIPRGDNSRQQWRIFRRRKPFRTTCPQNAPRDEHAMLS